MKKAIKEFKDMFPNEGAHVKNFERPPGGKKRILITGTGRCGTTYITRVMRNLGLDFGHEGMKRDGQASYKLAPWYGELSLLDDVVLVVLFRNKKDTVESIMRQGYLHPGRVVYRGLKQVCPQIEELETYRERVAYYYDRWYALCTEHAELGYYIERFDEWDLATILNRAGYSFTIDQIKRALLQTDPKQNSNLNKANKIDYEKTFK